MQRHASRLMGNKPSGAAFLTSGLGAVLALAQAAWAQDAPKDPPSLQRVEITGSSIKRIAAEGALPVTVIKADEIRASGVTSAVDLVKKLTSAQGAMGESTSVGYPSFGFSGISIHNLGESRTLVLLNGRRLAQFGGQDVTGFAAGFDLNAIPLAAVERVELLTDGASALYGADAIGGVVNFITKHNVAEGDVTLGVSSPTGGAREKRISATKGFGSLDDDGYNVMLSFGHDERTALRSADRAFGKTGQIAFSQGGKQYQLQRLSAFGIPANSLNLNSFELTNPALGATGACPSKSFRVAFPAAGTFPGDDYCGYDAVSDYEIYPERKRDNLMASWTVKAGNQELFADVLLSRTSQVSRRAATQGQLFIAAGSALHNQYLLPLGIVDDSLALYRISDLGRSVNSDTATFSNIVLGSRGDMFGWDYNAGFTRSTSRVRGNISGYPGALALDTLTASGLLNPFVGPGQQSAAGQAALAAASYNGYWNGGVARLDSLNWNGTRELVQMAGGAAMLGAGVNFNRESIESKPSLFAQGLLADPAAGTLCDGLLLPCDQRSDAGVIPPYAASRTSQGLFGELVLPVAKTLELGGGLRLDRYSDFGRATTGKASFRWTPAPDLLVRGSIGNGFRAPTVAQVKAPPQTNGFTSGQYACAGDLTTIATALGAVCTDGQLPQLARGNPNLKPEKSKQATLGIRFEPTNATSFGADLWHVQVSDRISLLPEPGVFANPTAFPMAFATQTDAFGTVNLAYLADNRNLGKSYTTGVDLDFSGKIKTDFGTLASQLTLTHVLREVSQLDKNGAYFSAVGNFADLDAVTFRTQGRLVTSLKNNSWTHTLGINFKSGYKDKETEVNVLDATGAVTGTEKVRVHVGSYATVDWQTAWDPDKKWSVVAGVLNLLDRKPPFVASFSGANRGLQVGYDDRYYDARGRTVYLNTSYKF